MKKILCVLLSLCMLAGICFTASATDASILLKDVTIVVSENPSDTDLYAAERLEYYLEKITGADISVTDQSTDLPVVFVGSAAGLEIESEDNGSYMIKSENNTVFIQGVGSRGTIYAVYGFLEKYCGCKWYKHDNVVIPENSGLAVENGIDYTYNTFFEYTQTDTMSSRDPEFSLANGHNGSGYVILSKEQGGTVQYISNFAHTLTTQFCKKDQYLESNPEYFALHEGERLGDQLCLTNPDVIKVVTDEVLALIAERYDPDSSLQIVSLTQHDNQNYCECEKCKAIDEANGSQSGTMINFANTVAQAVEEAGYTNIAIDTFAYQYTRKAPSVIVPSDNVIVRLCSIECCFGHTLDDSDCKENVSFMNDLRAWGEICDRIYVWDYVNNYKETICVFPNFHVLQRNVQVFYENNVKGVYEEGNYYIAESDGEFCELRTYLLSKLLQDPYIDLEPELDGYLKAVYGDGWASIKEFLSVMSDHAVTKRKHLGIFQMADETLYGMSLSDIRYCDELWEIAKDSAKTGDQYGAVLRSEFSWRYWKCANHKGEFSRLQLPYEWMSAQNELYHDLKEFGVVRLGEPETRYLSDCNLLWLLRKPFKWTVLYDEPFWDFLNPAVVAIYNFLDKVHSFF